jgi:hypothetical protein
MGLFDFLSGNYKPSDFANKTLEQIFKDIKLDKVDKSIKENEEYNALSDETKSAIDMLIDLKMGKSVIYDKCYKSKGARPGSMTRPMPPPSLKTDVPVASMPKAVEPMPKAATPMPKAIVHSPRPAPAPEPVEEVVVEGQEGGRRRKTRRGKSNKSNKSKRSKRSKKSKKSKRTARV